VFVAYNFGNVNINMTSGILGIAEKLSNWQQSIKEFDVRVTVHRGKFL